jgi:hypothetical protein
MAERSSELDDYTAGSRSTSDDSENVGLEIGAPTTYATTALGGYPNDADRTDASDDRDTTASEEPEEIRAEIEKTRSDMSETINAIQEKLTFSNISEQVKEEVSEHITSAVETARDAVYGATLGKVENFMAKLKRNVNDLAGDYGPVVTDAGTTVVRAARNNPLPMALIGLGIGMLLMNNRRSASRVSSYRYSEGYDEDTELGYDYSNQSGRRSRGRSSSSGIGLKSTTGAATRALGKVGDVAGSAYEGVSNVAGTAYSGVTTAASTAYEGVGSVANTAYEGVGSLGTHVKDAASWTQDTYSRQLEENPLAVGAVALALGAIVGLSLPSTQIEGQYMGEARENLLQKAQDAAGGLIDKAQQFAGDVTNSVKEEAKAQGFTA